MPLLQYYENEIPKFLATLTGGATDQYPQAKIYNYDLTLKETVNLTHNALGQYIGVASASYVKGNYSVVYIIYSDVGHTTENTDYWRSEDVLDVIYITSGGGGYVVDNARNVTIDVKKIAKAVWDHDDARTLHDVINKIK